MGLLAQEFYASQRYRNDVTGRTILRTRISADAGMTVIALVLACARCAQAGPFYAERLLRNARKAEQARLAAATATSDLSTDAGANGLELSPSNTPERLSRDIDRDAIAAKLDAAGFPSRLDAEGLKLWHIISYRGRGGQQVYFSLGLPSEGDAFTREPNAERRAELQRRLDAARCRIVSEAARILDLPETNIGAHERLIENCCGAGCQSCLLTKPEHAERFAGRPVRPLVER